MSHNNLNDHDSRRCCCCCYSWTAIIIVAATLLLKLDIDLYSSRSIENNPTNIFFATAFVTGPAITSPPLDEMSHRVAAVKKFQSSLIRRHRQAVAAAAAAAGTTTTTTTATKYEENSNSKLLCQSTKTKTTDTDNTTDAPRTRHSRQPLSPLQRRIFDDVHTDKTNINSNSRPQVAVRRIELSVTSSSALFIRGGGSGNTPVSIIPLVGEIRHPLYQSIFLFGLCDLAGLMISLASKGTHTHLDLIGTGAFAIVSGQYIRKKILSSSPPSTSSSEVLSTSSWISSIAVWLWAMKLTAFLTYRAFCVKEDSRLTETLNTVSGSIQFWVVTWIWNVLTSLPYTLALGSNASSCKLAMIVGFSLYLVGLTTETIADGQKWVFKQQKSNSSSFCNVGLWKYSQHPNFVGNFMLWIGIVVMNIGGLVDPLPQPIVSNWSTISLARRFLWRVWMVRKVLLAALSPLFLWTLFSGQANGTITSAKELADTKYGDVPGYVKYVEDTPTMFPNPFEFLRKGTTQEDESNSQEL